MEYIWKIVDLERDVNTGTVLVAHWKCDLVAEGQTFFSVGTTNFDVAKSGSTFIPYEDLTENIILSWVWGISKDLRTMVEASLKTQFEDTLEPKKATGTPWS